MKHTKSAGKTTEFIRIAFDTSRSTNFRFIPAQIYSDSAASSEASAFSNTYFCLFLSAHQRLVMSKTIVDPRAEAMKYLNQHKLLALFDILGARLAKEKPQHPNDFISEELGRIAQLKASGQPVRENAPRDASNSSDCCCCC